MYPPLRLGRLVALAISALALTGCASMRVTSYLERGIDFRQYHTYNWDSTDPQHTGDPRLDNNRFFFERVQADVEKPLAAKGFEKATSRPPDLLLHIHASITQRLDVNSADQKYGPCKGCYPYVYDAGTLLLDFVDTQSNRVIWRGWAADSLDGMVDDQQWMEENIDRAVARILEQLPGRL